MSFLEKLKKRVEEKPVPAGDTKTDGQNKAPADFLQLDVDIYETSKDIIIFAPMPACGIADLDISIEDENDVVTIQGKRTLPTIEGEEKPQLLRQECHWGTFYRQIILPQEINVNEVDAHLKDGVLVLKLPLLRIVDKGKRKITIKA